MHSSRLHFIAGAASGLALVAGRRIGLADDALKTLHIGCSAVESQAEAYWADEQGFFKKNGLAVEITSMKGGAATVAAVTGGGLNIGCSNPVSLGQAVQRGVPLVILVGASIWDSRFPSGYAVVAPNSAIKSAKDLEGQVVAVSSLGGLNESLMSAYVTQAGGNPATVKFIELPSSSLADELAQGRIAAAYLDSPELSGPGTRLRRLGPASDAVAKQFAQTVWFTSRDWLAQNKETASRFVATIIMAGKWAMANQVAAAGILAKRISVNAERTTMRYATTADPGLVQVVFDSANKNKLLPPLHATDFVWDGK